MLTTLNSLNLNVPNAVILRHANRYPILDMTRPELAELTPEGMVHAERFGTHLDKFKQLRIFHSPIKRCQQTAECISRGALSVGVPIEHVISEEALGTSYILNSSEVGRMSDLHGEHIVRLWLRGAVSPDIIHPVRHVVDRQLSHITERLSDLVMGGTRLDMHISHDWNIMILREHLLGIGHEEVGWLTYLDGLALSLQDGRLQVVHKEYRKEYNLKGGLTKWD